MNKNQANKRAKRNQVSKQKKKQRNINRVAKRKADANKRDKMMQFLTDLSKTQQKEVLKNMNKEEQ
tara:strand:- start:170 stop:367 length:198 start_codon:yes stop_codon:yes gene_type:complete